MKLSLLTGLTCLLLTFLLFGCSTYPNNYRSMGDSDADGVVNASDRCPGTLPGFTVDAEGCAADSDADGVFDVLDRCPGSAVDQVVDVNGCNGDQDRDGVFDSRDRCADSPAGKPVDLNGCGFKPEVVAEVVVVPPAVVVKNRDLVVYFEFDGTQLLPEFQAQLTDLMAGLNSDKIERINILGHTDNIGSDPYNLKLSQSRAETVASFLSVLTPGSADKIDLESFGERRPVADNATVTGRQLNRRVEIKVQMKGTEALAGS